MLYISEWLPNPEGSDAEGEWIELVNTSNISIDISGWTVGTGGVRTAKLSGVVSPHGYRVFPRTATKLPLRNTNGTVILYDGSGKVSDKVSFIGTAPEGKSVARVEGELVLFVLPTPGAPNTTPLSLTTPTITHSPGTTLTRPPSSLEIGGVIVGGALLVTALTLYAIRCHGYTQKFFSRGN